MSGEKTNETLTAEKKQQDAGMQVTAVLEEPEQEQVEGKTFHSAPIKLGVAAPPDLPPLNNGSLNAKVNFFQKSYGNLSTLRYFNYPIQAKLTIGQPNDKYEQEADRLADQVMKMPEPKSANDKGERPKVNYEITQRESERTECPEEEGSIQTKPIADQITPLVQRQIEPEEEEEAPEEEMVPEEEEEEPVQAKANSSQTPTITPRLESRINSLKGNGQPLSESTRSYFEPRFGYDFSGVRVHTGEKAIYATRALNSRAFTLDNNIAFNRGAYFPETSRGKLLLAHELIHIIQQGNNKLYPKFLNINTGSSYNGMVQRDEEPLECTAASDLITDLDITKHNFENLFNLTCDYGVLGRVTGDKVKDKLLALSGQYKSAYSNYAVVIRAAREEARNQEAWINICVGIGAGILLAVGAAYLLPATAAAGCAITASEAGIAAASALGQGLAGLAITSGLTKALSVSGTDLKPGGLDPKVLELRIWRNVAGLYRSATSLIETSRELHKLSNMTEFLIGEMRVHEAQGETKLSWDKVLKVNKILIRADEDLKDYHNILSDKIDNLYFFYDTAEIMSLDSYPKWEMEQDIWILWMSELSDPSVLDLDAIEDYLHGSIKVLGKNSRLGVDFGVYTTSEDEREARDAARREASKIRARLRKLEGGFGGSEVINLGNLGPAFHLAG